MPVLAFNPEQLLLLSTCALTEPSDRSPLRRLYLQAKDITTGPSWRETLREFADEKMVVGDKKGRLRLAKELECLLYLLHKPEETISLSRFGAPDIAESFLCRSGKTWVQLSVNFNETLEAIVYPLSRPMVCSWFADELLGDVRFARGHLPPAEPVTLSAPELILLTAAQSVYRNRVEALGVLSEDALKVTVKEIGSPEILASVNRVSAPFVSPDRLQRYVSDTSLLSKAARLLARRDLVSLHGGSFSFTRLSMALFDPGRILGVVAAKSFADRVNAKILYLYGDGALLMEPSEDLDLAVRLIPFPWDTTKEDLFERMMENLTPLPTPEITVPPSEEAPVDPLAATVIFQGDQIQPILLKVESGPHAGKVYQFTDDTTMGRDSANPLPLPDPRASRRHAELVSNGMGLWMLRDLASSNGTFVNGERINEPTPLKPGDKIRIGDTILLFQT